MTCANADCCVAMAPSLLSARGEGRGATICVMATPATPSRFTFHVSRPTPLAPRPSLACGEHLRLVGPDLVQVADADGHILLQAELVPHGRPRQPLELFEEREARGIVAGD